MTPLRRGKSLVVFHCNYSASVYIFSSNQFSKIWGPLSPTPTVVVCVPRRLPQCNHLWTVNNVACCYIGGCKFYQNWNTSERCGWSVKGRKFCIEFTCIRDEYFTFDFDNVVQMFIDCISRHWSVFCFCASFAPFHKNIDVNRVDESRWTQNERVSNDF